MRLSHPLLLPLWTPLQGTGDRICKLQVSVQILGLRCASDLYTLTFRHRAGALSVTKRVLEGALLTLMHLRPSCSYHSEGSHTGFCSKVHLLKCPPPPPHFLSLLSETNIEKEIKIIEEEVSCMVCFQHQLTVTPCFKFFCLMTSKGIHLNLMTGNWCIFNFLQ